MLVLVVYDVETESPEGRKRLRKVAKLCESHGQRVQNSVFECLLDSAQYIQLRAKIEAVADSQRDSLRYYNLGNNWRSRIARYGDGRGVPYDPQGPLII